MSKESRAQRLRLLLIAGILAPVLMAAAGWVLPYLLGRRQPDVMAPISVTGVVVALMAAVASMGLVSLLTRLHPALERALRRSGVQVGMEALEIAGYPVMLAVVTAAAFGEEMLFRGGLQPLVGIVPAALLFGFSHGGWRREMWAYVLAASLSGVVFGTALQLTGIIWVPVLAHAVHNIFSTLLMGKKVDLTWNRGLPRISLVPEPEEAEELTEVPADAEPVDEPVPAEADGPEPGPDDGDSADGRP